MTRNVQEARNWRGRPILLIEDNPDDAMLTIRALKKSNLLNEIIHLKDGEEALDYLFARGKYAGRDLSVLPELILLDLKLPKVGGLEVLEKLRQGEGTKFIPVVILSSSGEDKDLIRAYELGANSYVTKPIDFNEFGKAVKDIGLYWLVLNRSPFNQVFRRP
ncbi:response regulator [Methanocella sp. MCL-LM]|uniref:response regulator n=1 Tax=Methanocella sp. MCL-LM TaxID=3412035 RepID=UPI003C70E6B7